jgi:hypothetical protein
LTYRDGIERGDTGFDMQVQHRSPQEWPLTFRCGINTGDTGFDIPVQHRSPLALQSG